MLAGAAEVAPCAAGGSARASGFASRICSDLPTAWMPTSPVGPATGAITGTFAGVDGRKPSTAGVPDFADIVTSGAWPKMSRRRWIMLGLVRFSILILLARVGHGIGLRYGPFHLLQPAFGVVGVRAERIILYEAGVCRRASVGELRAHMGVGIA